MLPTEAKVQNGKEISPKVSTPGVGHTNVTDDRRIGDSKDPNVTYSHSGKNEFSQLSHRVANFPEI